MKGQQNIEEKLHANNEAHLNNNYDNDITPSRVDCGFVTRDNQNHEC